MSLAYYLGSNILDALTYDEPKVDGPFQKRGLTILVVFISSMQLTYCAHYIF